MRVARVVTIVIRLVRRMTGSSGWGMIKVSLHAPAGESCGGRDEGREGRDDRDQTCAAHDRLLGVGMLNVLKRGRSW
jgi:hypothetical protein